MKAVNKKSKKEVTFSEQNSETVVYSENEKHQAVVTKEEFNKCFDVIGESTEAQPAQ